MKINEIRLVTEIPKDGSGSIDVLIRSESGYTYCMEVCTPSYFTQEMAEENENFIKPQNPKIIVRKLEECTIREAITAYTKNDAYWLKLFQFSSEIDLSILDKLQEDHYKKQKKWMQEYL